METRIKAAIVSFGHIGEIHLKTCLKVVACSDMDMSRTGAKSSNSMETP